MGHLATVRIWHQASLYMEAFNVTTKAIALILKILQQECPNVDKCGTSLFRYTPRLMTKLHHCWHSLRLLVALCFHNDQERTDLSD